MSSDYIPRLRAELLRAGATSTARRRRPRPVLRPLALAATVALLVVAVVIALPQARDDEQPARRAETVRLEYRLPEAAAPIVRARLEAVGVRPAEVTASAGRLTVVVPRESRGVVGALVAPGRFAIYDWEASVLGPDGSPAPTDPDVTGGQDAGHGAALTEAEAKSRAADAGDAVAVHAGERWFALAGPAAITNAQLANARAATDPTMNEPIVALDFTAQGANAFTRTDPGARRARRRQRSRCRSAAEQPALRDRHRRPDRQRALRQLAGGPGRHRRLGRRADRRRADPGVGADARGAA